MAPKKQAVTRKVQTRTQAKSGHGAKKPRAVFFLFFFSFLNAIVWGTNIFLLKFTKRLENFYAVVVQTRMFG